MRDDDLRAFDANYPTMSCLLRLAVIGLVFLLIAVPLGLAFLAWLFSGITVG